MMDGEIGVESAPGEGSRFWFTLPFTLSTTASKKAGNLAAARSQPYAGLRVLVAEDNPINLRIVDFQLRKMGFEVVPVVNGQEALDKYLGGGITATPYHEDIVGQIVIHARIAVRKQRLFNAACVIVGIAQLGVLGQLLWR